MCQGGAQGSPSSPSRTAAPASNPAARGAPVPAPADRGTAPRTVTVTGALDLAAIAALLEDLYGLIDAGHARLILDLGGLRLCDATGTSTSTPPSLRRRSAPTTSGSCGEAGEAQRLDRVMASATQVLQVDGVGLIAGAVES